MQRNTKMSNKKHKVGQVFSLSDDEDNIDASSDSDSDDTSMVKGSSFKVNDNGSKRFKKANEVKGGVSEGIYSEASKKLMAKMGFKEGEGLGKYNQGRKDIIKTANQRGRRGLGTQIHASLEPNDEQWDFENDEVITCERVSWLPDCLHKIPPFEQLRTWIKRGPRKTTIDNEYEFCDEETLIDVISSKSILDNMEGDELRRARTRSNPYETIRGVFFLNRAAMKMANMDAVFDFMFTNPLTEKGDPAIDSKQLLYFADVCAGPGGFSEYVLWRKKWKAKGFGFTLKDTNDFKLEDFFAGPCETFEPHYGSKGDGDVFNPDNQQAFRDFVLKSTNDEGVSFMMADGGFSVEGQENIQEILSKQLYLCQFLVALSIVRPGGHFVCKLFDIFTPFSVGLIYLMYLCFKKISIFKPVTSRPANSERYIVCKWLRNNTNDVREYMDFINKELPMLWKRDQDINEIVPIEMMKEDESFYEYIKSSNDELGKIQILNLKKIHAFYKNPTLHEARQSSTREECLKLWDIPSIVRASPKRPDPSSYFKEITKNELSDYMAARPTLLDEQNLQTCISNVRDHCCVVTGGRFTNKEDFFFVLSLGRSHVYRWDGTGKMDWRKLNGSLELPKGTFFHAEIVNELQGEGQGQKKNTAMHILDVAYLGEENVSNLSYQERMERAEMFVHAVSKPGKQNYTTLRVKKMCKLDEIEQIFNEFELHAVKGKGTLPRMCYPCEKNRFYLPLGIIIYKVIQKPWVMAFSRSQQKNYFFNIGNKESTFEVPKGAFAIFKSTFDKRVFWSWDEGVESSMGLVSSSKTLQKDYVINFITNQLK